MIDIHSHILPGIDDGVKTEEEAVDFARMAVEDGISVIVATPHCKEGFYPNDRDIVLGAVERLREVLRAAEVEVRIEPGAEVDDDVVVIAGDIHQAVAQYGDPRLMHGRQAARTRLPRNNMEADFGHRRDDIAHGKFSRHHGAEIPFWRQAELDVDVGEAEITVEQQGVTAGVGQGMGQGDGEPGLADAALSRRYDDDVAALAGRNRQVDDICC